MCAYRIEHYLTAGRRHDPFDYAVAGARVLLLCGGGKNGQQADIERAVCYWQDWQQRGTDEKPIP